LASVAVPAVFADGAVDQEAQAQKKNAPEPEWYALLAVGALVPAGFYLKRRLASQE
jgi:hypothetical protein